MKPTKLRRSQRVYCRNPRAFTGFPPVRPTRTGCGFVGRPGWVRRGGRVLCAVGFLITGLLWKELQDSGRLRLGAFYARRARRLLPAAVLVLVVTLVASAVWLSPLQVPVVAADALSAALYGANYRFAAQRTDYLADASPSPLQHYWSLGVEEQFYLLWPLLLLVVFLAVRRGRRSATRAAGAAVLAVVASGSFVLSVHQTAVSQPWAFFGTPSRVWGIAPRPSTRPGPRPPARSSTSTSS